MRGGTTWDWCWLELPTQPAVIVGTVDQLGRRLLFRGYGVGPRLQPIDAALVGCDILLVLDEAHLARPFVETIRAAHAYEATAEGPVLPQRRHRPVVLSATLPDDVDDVGNLDFDAERSEAARARLDRVAQVSLVDLAATTKTVVADLARAMANLALAAVGDEVERVLVTCNTVSLAREVFGLLSEAEQTRQVNRALLIGRCREFERQEVSARWLSQLAADRSPEALERPLVAVATQTVEVGADLDVDYLVTEAAPVDALAQRLGRLNRFGRRPRADAVVVHAYPRHQDDVVYGDATDRTWTWLSERAGWWAPVKPEQVVALLGSAPTLDLGPRALAGACPRQERAGLSPEPALTPMLLGPTLAAWGKPGRARRA